MSWLRRLLQIFKSEEDSYIDEKNPDEPKQRARESDMEAKVIYQYPKGQFRFPVIPDDDNRQDSRRRERKQMVQVPAGENGKSSVPRSNGVRGEKDDKVMPFPSKHGEKVRPSSKPFRPTEIPSPIYGYEAPPKKNRPVEYELGEFSVKNAEKEEELRTSGSPQMETIDDSFAEEKSQASHMVEEIVFSETPELRESNAEPEVEDEILISSAQPEEETAIAEQLEQSDKELESSAELDVEEEMLTGPFQPKEEIPTAEQLEQSEIKLESGLDGEEEEIQLEPSPEEEPVQEKKRSHIPFNVIMLKEDKRKLAERLRVQEESPAKQDEIDEEKEEAMDTIPAPLKGNEQQIQEEKEIIEQEPYYAFPSLELLTPPIVTGVDQEWLDRQEQQLNETLVNFNVRASVANVTQGPSVTRFEVHPEPGVKVNKIKNLTDDIKLSLAAKDIRMEAPIPGTHMIGIEVPNQTSRPVFISEIITSAAFLEATSPLTAVLGLDISGKPIVTDLRKMPHGLIAGATGSGKSVCINSILVSLLYKANPNDVKLMLIDPKMVELAPYNQIPHLVSPVITDVKAATAALKWAVEEMERRYELFVHAGVREITKYNELVEEEKNYSLKLPYIVIIIDELADLMMMSPADVEEAICRIAQKARACGIHLIIATQRPSVDVITGLIKANVPTRIAFSVSSQVDSRTIIDISGAERLLGRGDMLFLENGSGKPIRLQGTFVSDEEIDAVVAHVKKEQQPNYLFEQEELLKKTSVSEEEDELFYEACEYIIEQGGASTSSLQRRFKIGYNRAARLIDMMEEQGFISEARGSKPRDVLITEMELEAIQEGS